MKYAEFRVRLKALCFGESAYKENIDELKTITQMALEDVATRVVPAKLVSSDMRRYPMLRAIDSLRFVRRPETIVSDDSEIDLDDSLITALLYRTATQIVGENKRQLYEALYRKELDNYVFARFYSMQEEF